MRFQLFINASATGVFFGVWQQSFWAGGALFLLLGFVLSAIDYAQQHRGFTAEGK